MRSSGILLHIASLPSKYGVGSIGSETDNFIKFLSRANQSYWQILPVNPVDFVNSPYASPSTFAGNYLLIDPEALVEDELISHNDIADMPRCNDMDYETAKVSKRKILKTAFFNFFAQPNLNEFFEFIDANADWLEDYALFSALKDAHGGAVWQTWEKPLALRQSDAIEAAKVQYEEQIDFYRFEQFIFYKQWKAFRAKLDAANIRLIGDMPFYVAYDSADVWTNQNLFLLDKNGLPKCVAGVAPDYFSKDGQLWGNPIYNFNAMRKDDYAWWKKRIAHYKKLFDALRIDHFRAFDSYYTVKYGRKNAKIGRWVKNDGVRILSSILQNIEPLTVLAEDLGNIPDSVYTLRERFGLDGMKVMQFAFDGNSRNPFLPENYQPNCIAYLGTHDNQTTLGWYESLQQKTKKAVCEYLQLPPFASGQQVVNQMMTKLSASAANLVIFAMQDLNCLSDNYRMNTPGTTGCWKYMESAKNFSMATALALEQITRNSGREKK